MLVERLEEEAMCDATVTAEPPLSVPLLGLVPMARLTWVLLSPVSTLPLASSTATVTAGEIAEPACASEGPWTNTSWLPVVATLNGCDVDAARAGELDAVRV